jgi:hypothetical protein
VTCRACCRPGRWLLAIACLLAANSAALARPAAWTVILGASDVTKAAQAFDGAGVLMLDIAGLAAALGLSVRIEGGKAMIRDSQGLEWQATSGSALLGGEATTLPLASPSQIDGSAVHLPAAAVAELAQLTLTLDPESRTAYLDGASVPGPTAPPGWEAVSLPSALPRSKGPGLGGDEDGEPDILPPAHDVLHLGLDASHTAGGDWGMGLRGAGSFRGFETNLYGLVTNGPDGYQPYNRYLGMVQPHGWGFEAGDLFSDVYGRAEGLRWLGNLAPGGASRPALSLYLPVANSLTPRTVVAGRDELLLGKGVALDGELATDGSWQASGRYQQDRFGLFAFGREVAASGPGMGVSGFMALPLGMDAQAAWNRGGRGDQAITWRNLALRVPMAGVADLGAEVIDTRSQQTAVRTATLRFGVALGPVLLRTSYEWLSGNLDTGSGFSSSFGDRELRAGIAYAPSRWLRFDLSSFNQTSAGGATQRWLQLWTSLHLPTRTTLEVILTSAGAPFHDPVHIRLGQEITRGFGVFAEYGLIASFQGADSGLQQPGRFLIGVRKVWDVATPPGGGLVEGRVTSLASGPARGIPVALGPYRAHTDDQGGFVFRNVPPGDYPLALPPSAVPAAYSVEQPQTVAVTAHQPSTANIALVPLCGVVGRVYLYRTGDGGRHPSGSGVAGVVVHLDDQLTTTREDGVFEFQNLPPGAHHLSIDRNHLPAGVTVTIPSEMELGLPPGRTLDGVELRLVPKQKTLVVQELAR